MKTIKEFQQVRDWAQARGLYDKGDVKTQFVKLAEEFGEVANAIIKNKDSELKDGIGDMLVVMINLAHIAGTSMEECLELAYEEIKNRTGSMQNGSFVKDTIRLENKYFQCNSLEEINMCQWGSHFEIGKTYKEGPDKICAPGTIHLYSDKDNCFYVDEIQFTELLF